MPRNERTFFPFPMTVAYAGVLFIALLAIMRAVLSAVGFEPPARPEGQTLLGIYSFLVPAVMLLSGALALLARGMSGGFLARWLSLGFFGWLAFSLNTSLGMSAMVTTDAVDPIRVALYLLAITLVPTFAAAAVAAGAFVPGEAHRGFPRRARAVWRSRSPLSWAWRIPLVIGLFALLSALATYVLMPVVGAAPARMQLEPAAVLVIELLRGLLLSAAVLPIVIDWERSNRQLFFTLTAALAIPAAAAAWIVGYFLPAPERAIGLLEILVTSSIFSGIVSLLVLGAHADDEIDALNQAELVPSPG